jgi:2-polyprenyl-3-methyl-5-hydroxy-6-metoxy-1,4-benzoquinol methylase
MPSEPADGQRQATQVAMQALCRLTHLAALAAQTTRRTAMTEVAADPSTTETDTLVERLFGATIGALELASIHLGGRLGFYRSLADDGEATAIELATRTGTASRYVREWLEQQAVAGFLGVNHSDAEPAERRYHLPHPHRAVFVEQENLNYLTPLATLAVGVLGPIDALLTAYRTGGGVRYEDYGADVREGVETLNRPMFANQLADWLAAIPEIDHRLRAEPPARIADLACGSGWSSVAIARAYPRVTVEAIDIDVASIEAAKGNVAAVSLADRVQPIVADASATDLGGPYDLITIFEGLHDMNHPVAALRAARKSLTDGGSVLIADEKVAEHFTAPGDELERFNYGWSILHCLAVGLLDDDSAGTGTVLRPETVRAYAADAGFGRVEVLSIDHDFWRFYRLVP